MYSNNTKVNSDWIDSNKFVLQYCYSTLTTIKSCYWTLTNNFVPQQHIAVLTWPRGPGVSVQSLQRREPSANSVPWIGPSTLTDWPATPRALCQRTESAASRTSCQLRTLNQSQYPDWLAGDPSGPESAYQAAQMRRDRRLLSQLQSSSSQSCQKPPSLPDSLLSSGLRARTSLRTPPLPPAALTLRLRSRPGTQLRLRCKRRLLHLLHFGINPLFDHGHQHLVVFPLTFGSKPRGQVFS